MFRDKIKADAETYMADYLAVKGENMVPGRGVAGAPMSSTPAQMTLTSASA